MIIHIYMIYDLIDLIFYLYVYRNGERNNSKRFFLFSVIWSFIFNVWKDNSNENTMLKE